MSDRRPPAGLVAAARSHRGVRVLARLDPGDGLEYARATAAVAGRIEASLDEAVVASRASGRALGPRAGSVVRLEPWRPARRRFVSQALSLGAVSSVVAGTDVRDCYASIADAPLARRLGDLGSDPSEIGRILRLLDRVHADGVRGLPVGPDASAVLANAVLSVMDRALAVRGVAHLRWVDDVLVFGHRERDVRRALIRLEDALGGVGLALAPEKTSTGAGGRSIVESLRRMRISAMGSLL